MFKEKNNFYHSKCCSVILDDTVLVKQNGYLLNINCTLSEKYNI